MIQIYDCRSVYAAKMLRIKSRFKFIQSYSNEIGSTVRVDLDIIVGAYEPKDVGNIYLNDPAAGVAYKKPDQTTWGLAS